MYTSTSSTTTRLAGSASCAQGRSDDSEHTSDEYEKRRSTRTAYELFTPVAPQMQYALCSPIVDENGTLYFKNDSGYLMAYGSMV